MSTVFIGGSRHISRLPSEIEKRLDNIQSSEYDVVVGDASGADRAIQIYLHEANYSKVTVYCSGIDPRHNIGSWPVRRIRNGKSTKGFQFHAMKDRQMAVDSDFGLMVWDGKSPGTLLNSLRLVLAGKPSAVFSVPQKRMTTVKSREQWNSLLAECSEEVRSDVKERATPEEWEGEQVLESPQGSLLALMEEQRAPESFPIESVIRSLNVSLASGDASAVLVNLGALARHQGMTQVAKDTGLARESLYRALDAGGNPEFLTVLKVFFSMGLRLEAKNAQ